MPLTQVEHDDLSARLEQLIGEYAAASQRTEAVGRLHGVLAKVAPEAEAPAAPEPVEPSAPIQAEAEAPAAKTES